jgi:hypothetical protein
VDNAIIESDIADIGWNWVACYNRYVTPVKEDAIIES